MWFQETRPRSGIRRQPRLRSTGRQGRHSVPSRTTRAKMPVTSSFSATVRAKSGWKNGFGSTAPSAKLRQASRSSSVSSSIGSREVPTGTRCSQVDLTSMSQASERRVLVPGGAGYIGSVLTPTLLAAGYRVRVLDPLLYGNVGTLAGVLEDDGFEFVHGDVRSAEQVRSAMDDVTDVVLLAALVGDPVCKRNPDLASQTNLNGARNVIAAAAEASVERLVFASTCSNYGLREDDTPADE